MKQNSSSPVALPLLGHKLSLHRMGAAALLGLGALVAAMPAKAQLVFGNNPLYLVAGKANVLMILDNSNSMDEAPNGAAAGSANSGSKSEIARGILRGLSDAYVGRINMGLMAYKQSGVGGSFLHNSPYDVSFDPAHYNPAWTGARASPTNKRFRWPNPTSPGNYVHYNVALPFYSGSNAGTAFCYSNTASAANDFNNGEDIAAGPWDNYRCFNTKTGTDNTLPTWASGASESARGWTSFSFASSFSPTDSDFAQGILDFGRFNSWNYVSRAWFSGSSPGRGYLHVPIKELTAAHATSLKAKLACNIPDAAAPCTNGGIQNAGLTPIQGTLQTARDYFRTTWTTGSEGYIASCYPMPESCNKRFVVLLTDGLPSSNSSGTIYSNRVLALNEAAAAAAELRADGVLVYIIGFALPYGTDPATLDTLAASGGTGTAYNAADSAGLTAAFNAIFADILRRTSSFGSVAQNSTSINTGSMIFQGRFDSTDWSGEVLAFRPTATGGMTELWNSAAAGKIPAASSRKVFTWVPGSGSGPSATSGTGAEFKLRTALNSTQQAALGTTNCSASMTGDTCIQNRINWIRGDQSNEAPSGPLRRRSRVHGDVISSSPYYVEATKTVFVGGNDGMLHAIDTVDGSELFTYVPNAVVSKLYKLTETTYVHDYYVDGEIAVSTPDVTPSSRILVGALGRGGRALYALDVTTPSSFSASNVKWEFTDADLGQVLGKLVIVKLNNGVNAVIVGNGYNSDNHRSFLFIINLDTGALIRKIDTSAGAAGANTNGMASPRGWDADGNGTVDIVYAGDLLGNMWKFDLSAALPASWGSANMAGATPAPMFVAKDSSNNRQPITGMPGVGINSDRTDANYGKRYVFFATGRYLTSSDVTNTATQTWYGLIDEGGVIPRSQLRQRSISMEGTVASQSARAFSQAAAGDMAGKQGWYLDLLTAAGAAQGERMIGEQAFYGRLLLATSVVPSSDICTPGGTGYLNAINPYTGAALTNPFFDLNNDLVLNDTDTLTASHRLVGSVNPGINMPSDSHMVGNRLITSGTSGAIRSTSVNTPLRSGRIAWREVVGR